MYFFFTLRSNQGQESITSQNNQTMFTFYIGKSSNPEFDFGPRMAEWSCHTLQSGQQNEKGVKTNYVTFQ